MPRLPMWKIALSVGAAGVMVCAAAATGLARPAPRGGGHGGAHFAGHAGGGRHAGGVAHFAGHRGAAHTHVGHARSFTARHAGGVHAGADHGAVRHTSQRASHVPAATVGAHAATTPVTPAGRVGRRAGRTDPREFAARRRFAANTAFRPFLGHHRWGPHNHLGWVGPLFWPYAYGDFFYYALWPGEYNDADPFWAYGYGDIYEGIFSPYSYNGYVQGPGAPARMTGLTQGVTQACADEAAEVTGWPIDQIQQVVQPSDQQRALLDDLGNSVVKAGDEIKSHCPTSVAFTPPARIAEMQQRLQTMIQAVNIVDPPLTKFYDSLSDEQKARFNEMGAPGSATSAQSQQAADATNPKAVCGANATAWPTDQVDRIVQPTDAQRPKLAALQSAAAQAADIIKAACPSETPRTPPSRLEAVGQRLQAMLKAVQTVEPPLQSFYDSLSDDQKARFNTIGRQILAAH
jgi:hypothetical protein